MVSSKNVSHMWNWLAWSGPVYGSNSPLGVFRLIVLRSKVTSPSKP